MSDWRFRDTFQNQNSLKWSLHSLKWSLHCKLGTWTESEFHILAKWRYLWIQARGIKTGLTRSGPSLSHGSPWVLLLLSVYLKGLFICEAGLFTKCSTVSPLLPGTELWLSLTPWRTCIPQHHCLHRLHAVAATHELFSDQGSEFCKEGRRLNCFSAVLMKLLWNDLYLFPLLFFLS